MKNNPLSTSIKQSLFLSELGLTHNTADFWWIVNGAILKPCLVMKHLGRNYPNESYTKIPAWSLSTLINLLPNCFVNCEGEYEEYTLNISKSSIGYVGTITEEELFYSYRDNLMEATIDGIEWLIKQGWSEETLLA